MDGKSVWGFGSCKVIHVPVGWSYTREHTERTNGTPWILFDMKSRGESGESRGKELKEKDGRTDV